MVASVRLSGEIGQRSRLVAPDLGLRCDLTNSFTVEGWYRKEGNPGGRLWNLAGARDDANGWMLSLGAKDGRTKFHLHVSDVSRGGRLQFERFFQNADVTSDTNLCVDEKVYARMGETLMTAVS